MTHLPLKLRATAMVLACMAGFVDALGFLHLGGYFTSFMTGNSTRMAVGLAESVTRALMPAGLIALFVLGVFASTLASAPPLALSPRRLLLSIAGLLAFATILALAGFGTVAIMLTPVAMGAMNTAFQRDGEVAFGVTYMTGALVKLGQRLAITASGGAPWGWLPHLMLWSGLLFGALGGSLAYPVMGVAGLMVPAAVLTLVAWLGFEEPAHGKV